MILGQLDAAIRAAAVATVLMLAWLLRGGGPQAALFLPLALCIAGFVVGNTPIADLRPGGLVGAVAHAASGFTVVFLWWFCLSCFDRRFQVRGGVLAVGLAWAGIAALDRGLLGTAFADRGLSRLLVPFGFAIVGHLVCRLMAERRGDLIQQRHDARMMVAVLLGGMLAVDLAADALFGYAWRPLAFAMIQNAMVLGFGLWLARRTLMVRPGALGFERAEEAAGATDSVPADDVRDGALRRRLTALIEEERVFLDPELDFAGFVARMGASERAVRVLVNHELGHDHFRAFLNHHRVAEARRLLADRGRADDKLVTIALDSGFSSLASFNRAFRAIAGCAPSRYRASARPAERYDDIRPMPAFEERKAGF